VAVIKREPENASGGRSGELSGELPNFGELGSISELSLPLCERSALSCA